MLTPHLSEANELLNEHWAKIVLSEKNSTSISTLIMFKKWMPLKLNAITCIDKRFAVKNSGISCLALIFYLSNPRMTILHAENRFKVAKHPWLYTVFFCKLIWTHGLVVKVSSKESGDMGLIPPGRVWRHGFDSSRVLKVTTALFMYFIFFEFLQWHSLADKVLALKRNILLALWSKSAWKRLAFFFSLNQKYWKNCGTC